MAARAGFFNIRFPTSTYRHFHFRHTPTDGDQRRPERGQSAGQIPGSVQARRPAVHSAGGLSTGCGQIRLRFFLRPDMGGRPRGVPPQIETFSRLHLSRKTAVDCVQNCASLIDTWSPQPDSTCGIDVGNRWGQNPAQPPHMGIRPPGRETTLVWGWGCPHFHIDYYYD